MTRLQLRIAATFAALVALWFLPRAVDSWFITALLYMAVLAAAGWGIVRSSWRPAVLIGTYVVLIDLFGIAQLAPALLSLVVLILWLGGMWVVGHIGGAQPQIFHQALTSFLVLEVFLVLQLWPINILSKAVIVVSFAFFLWHEFVRSVSPRQRLQESVIPFLLIVTLMTLTARWFSY